MTRVCLGDVANERKENCKTNEYNDHIVGLEHLIPQEITLTQWAENIENTFTKVFHKGDVLFGRRRAYLKKAVVAPFDGICSGDITVIEAKPNKIVPELLPFIIQNDNLFDYAVEKSAGSLSPRVKWSHLQNYEFELPNLEKQQQIAEILCAAETTRQAYKTIIQKTDSLLKATFSQMFENAKKEKIGDVCDIKARIGWQGLKKKEYLTTGNYHLVTGVDFVNNRIDFDHCYYVSFERYQQDENIQLKEKDVLLTKDGTIGKVAYVDLLNLPATLNSGIFVLRDKCDKLESLFLYYCLMTNDFNDFVDGFKTGSTIPHLNQSALINYEIPIPSRIDQNRYIDFARSIELYRANAISALNKLNNFISSIVNENFSKEVSHV